MPVLIGLTDHCPPPSLKACSRLEMIRFSESIGFDGVGFDTDVFNLKLSVPNETLRSIPQTSPLSVIRFNVRIVDVPARTDQPNVCYSIEEIIWDPLIATLKSLSALVRIDICIEPIFKRARRSMDVRTTHADSMLVTIRNALMTLTHRGVQTNVFWEQR